MNSCTMGIDVGGTQIKAGLFGSDGSLIQKTSVPTHAEEGKGAFIESITVIAEQFKNETSDITSAGIGIAGVLDTSREVLVESPNLPMLNNFSIKNMLSEVLSVPVYIENDANVAALGELCAGAGQGQSNFLLFTIGTGIGSGLILSGKLWKGETGKAGEFGHLIVEPDGALCGCGKTGCLEAHASGTAITRMARSALLSGRESTLSSITDVMEPGKPTPEEIYIHAENGDELSLDIYNTAARYLSIAISNVNNLIDIHHFIVGGGISKAFHLFKKPLLLELRSRIFTVSQAAIRVVLSELGNDAGIYGAAYLARTGKST